MPRTPIVDTAGACWLAEHAGRPVSPRIAALRMDVEDSGARRVRRGGKLAWHRPASLSMDVAEQVECRVETEQVDYCQLAEQVRNALADLLGDEQGKLVADLLGTLPIRSIADQVGVSKSALHRAIAQVRKSLGQEADLFRNGRND